MNDIKELGANFANALTGLIDKLQSELPEEEKSKLTNEINKAKLDIKKAVEDLSLIGKNK
jgi:hypothetical protein